MGKPPPAGTGIHRSDASTATLAPRVRRAVFEALVGKAGDDVALTVPPATQSSAPAELAGRHPGGVDAQRRMASLYETCLAHYRDSWRPEDRVRGIDDVRAAAARFVAVNLHVLQGVDPTPQTLTALEHQLTRLVQLTSAWDRAGEPARQCYFESLALLAVYVAESWTLARAQGAAAVENVRQAARRYLHELLGIDPEWLALTPAGLQLRAAATTDAAVATAS